MIYETCGIKESIIAYNRVLFNLENENDRMYAIYRKGLLLVQEKLYKEAENCFEVLNEEKCPSLQSEVNYYKGILHSTQSDLETALLYFEQSIKRKTSEKFVRQAQLEKLMILLKKKDYYSAEYELERIPENEMSENTRKVQ